MKNNLLITTALVAMGFVAGANALEYTPYVSAKAAYGWMKNDIKMNMHYLPGTEDSKLRDGKYDENHKDNMWGLRVAAGASTPVAYGKIRTELEFGWNDDTEDSHYSAFTTHNNKPLPYKLSNKLSVYSTMINMYYDFDTQTVFTPYIGVGFGIAHLKNKSTMSSILDENPFSTSKTVEENHFAWNINAGVSYALTDNVSLDLGYRYTNFGKIRKATNIDFGQLTGNTNHGIMNAPAELKVDAHEVNFGVRYSF